MRGLDKNLSQKSAASLRETKRSALEERAETSEEVDEDFIKNFDAERVYEELKDDNEWEDPYDDYRDDDDDLSSVYGSRI